MPRAKKPILRFCFAAQLIKCANEIGGRRGDPQARCATAPSDGSGRATFWFWPLLTEVRRLTVHDWTQKTTVLPDLSAQTTDIKAPAHLKHASKFHQRARASCWRPERRPAACSRGVRCLRAHGLRKQARKLHFTARDLHPPPWFSL